MTWLKQQVCRINTFCGGLNDLSAKSAKGIRAIRVAANVNKFSLGIVLDFNPPALSWLHIGL
jgi:tRNA G26 N,N-dimethylase Trm1